MPRVKTRRTDLVISEWLKRKIVSFLQFVLTEKFCWDPHPTFSCFSKTCYLSVWSSLLMILFKCSVFLLILGVGYAGIEVLLLSMRKIDYTLWFWISLFRFLFYIFVIFLCCLLLLWNVLLASSALCLFRQVFLHCCSSPGSLLSSVCIVCRPHFFTSSFLRSVYLRYIS